MATTRLYEVFARRTRAEPLGHIGTIRAADDEFARVYARTTYDEENWAEMTIVPRQAVVHVRELEPLVDVGAEVESDDGAGAPDASRVEEGGAEVTADPDGEPPPGGGG